MTEPRYQRTYDSCELPSQSYFDITPELLMQLVTQGNEIHAKITEGYPEGTKIVGITFEPRKPGDPDLEGLSWVRVFVKNDKTPLPPGGKHITVETLPCQPRTTP